MDNPLTVSLSVAGIGMLMLFLALVFLYGLMYLMTALIKERPEAEKKVGMVEGKNEDEGVEEHKALRRWAALIAVALARVELNLSPLGAPRTEPAASAWWALYHQRQLGSNLPKRGR